MGIPKSSRCSATAMLLVTMAVFFGQCGQEAMRPGPRLAPVQPNPSSELAEAMRQLDAEMVVFRTRFLEGDGRWDEAAFTEYDLNALEPTDSSMFVEGYTAFALAFHKRIEAFNAAPGPDTYTGVVDGCASCHQRACPGPLERIAQRKLP